MIGVKTLLEKKYFQMIFLVLLVNIIKERFVVNCETGRNIRIFSANFGGPNLHLCYSNHVLHLWHVGLPASS